MTNVLCQIVMAQREQQKGLTGAQCCLSLAEPTDDKSMPLLNSLHVCCIRMMAPVLHKFCSHPPDLLFPQNGALTTFSFLFFCFPSLLSTLQMETLEKLVHFLPSQLLIYKNSNFFYDNNVVMLQEKGLIVDCSTRIVNIS